MGKTPKPKKKYPRTEAQAAYQREFYQANKEKILAQQRTYYLENPGRRAEVSKKTYEKNKDKILIKRKKRQEDLGQEFRDTQKNYWLKSTYGITIEDYNRMLEAQSGVCAICENPPTGTMKKGSKIVPMVLAVDHDHNTNIVRSLLCLNCNTGIGGLKENPAFLRKAADMIEFHALKNKNAKTN